MSKSLISFNGQDDPTSFLPAGWKAEQLNAICDIFGGGRLGPTKEKDYKSTGVLAFSAAGPDGFVEQAEISDKSGVILSAIGANCGRCFFAQGDWTTLANVQAIVPKSEINPKYLYYFVNRDGYWDKSGSAQPFIKPSSIRSSWIGYPPKPEQSKIAEVLSKVDQAIEQTESLIAKQQRIKTGLMQDLLTRGIDEHGNLRSEETHEFKDSPLGRIPVEWEVCQLGNLVIFTQGIQVPLECQYSQERPGLTRFLRIVDYTQSTSDIRFAKCFKDSALVKEDDIVVVRYGATAGFIGSGLIGAIANNLFRIIPQNNRIDQAYLYNYLTSSYSRNFLINCRGASAMPAINFSQIRSLLIKVPPIIEQIKMAEILSQASHQINKTEATQAKLRSLKTALMQDLLTGKVRVTPLLEKTEVHS